MYPHAAPVPPVMSNQLPAGGYNVNAAPYIYSTMPPSANATPIPQTLPPHPTGAGQQQNAAAEIDHRFVMQQPHQQQQQYGPPYNNGQQQQYNNGSYY